MKLSSRSTRHAVLWTWAAVAFASRLVLPRRAQAHAIGLSKGDYVVSGSDVIAEFTLSRSEVALAVPSLDENGDGEIVEREFASGAAFVKAPFVAGVVVEGDGKACTGVGEAAHLTEEDGVAVRVRYRCAAPPSTLRVRVPLIEKLSNGHRQIARITLGDVTREEILYRGHEEITLHGSQTAIETERPRAGFVSFLRMGIEHILTGYDHLVFLFGLLLVGGRTRSLVGVVTAFTLAHSITLGLAALDVWSPPSRVIEAGIALSIIYVGLENLFVNNAEGRWRITFPFGLVHGFGFASTLREVALSRAQIPIALVSFNLGVEIGQLLVMALVLPPLFWLRKRAFIDRRTTVFLSVCVAGAGATWLVARIF
ncbi:MAG TPA: HupE/UreJ family protein [Polyangiaceae bacterium]|jgi:hydrogenase/urease accessory protein HupE|nr:HupE/UreJ family protein [Polyangiaceae bacterium]